MLSKAVVAALVGLIVVGASGCSAVEDVQTRVSMAGTCVSAAGIMQEMGEIGLLLSANPLAAATYADRLSELSTDLDALGSGDPELDGALDDVSAGVNTIIESLRNPGVEALGVIPEQIAQTQVAFMAVGTACEGLLR